MSPFITLHFQDPGISVQKEADYQAAIEQYSLKVSEHSIYSIFFCPCPDSDGIEKMQIVSAHTNPPSLLEPIWAHSLGGHAI